VEIKGVVLNVNAQVAIKIHMNVGMVTQAVEIVDGASLISESPAVGTLVDRQFVENLPLNGRSFQTLIALTPGVVLTKTTIDNQGQFSVNGQRSNANYFTVDGVSANIGVSPGTNVGVATSGTTPGLAATGGTNNLVSVDALQEFKILTSTFAPEFGRTPGAQVQIVTRSGTNEFHGSIFEYFRNDALDATDWFANSIGKKKAPLRQNDFGGVFSGPLFLPRFGEGGPSLYTGKNRTFFFFSYEGLRLRLPKTGITSVPSVNARSVAPVGIQPFLNAFPLPNGKDLGNNLAEFNTTYSDPSSLNATSIRIDHTISDKFTLFARYNYAPSQANQRGFGFALSAVNASAYKTETLTGGATVVLTPRISNDFRANYSRNRGTISFVLDNFGGAVVLPDSLLFPAPMSGADSTFFIGLGSISLQTGSFGSDLQRQVNLVDTLSIIKGAHQLKFGLDYRRLFPIFDRANYAQQAAFSSVTTAVTTGRALLANVQAFTDPRFPVFTNFSLFGQDTWKLARRLTLTYGLRWEFTPPPSDANGNDPFTVTGLDNPATVALAPAGTPLYKTTYNNFAPRVGVAYQLSQAKGRETTLRGGFGIFFDLGTGPAASAFAVSFPYFRNKRLLNVPFPLDPVSATPLPFSLNPVSATLLGILDPNFKLPYTYQWNLAVEQALGVNQTISASYVAAVGRRLPRQETIANPIANFTSFRVTRNLATSDYHSLQLQFQRRLSRHLQTLASYTWSHSFDNVSSDASLEAPIIRIDPKQERGPSDFDVRQAFSAAVTYDLPAPDKNNPLSPLLRNFSVDSTFTARTTTPVNVSSGTRSVGGTNVSRPDLGPGVPLYVSDRLVGGGRRINRAAFTVPVGRQGTLGRNALRGFPLWQQDLGVQRLFNLTERLNLKLRAEFFNVFNHPNFGDPGAGGTGTNALNNPLFGQSTVMLANSLGTGGSGGGFNPLYQVGGSRSIQLSLKFSF